jgi:DNA-binding NarL/FixJ family response regulator
MKVLIADDHQLIREGLKSILSEIISVADIDEASEGNEALQQALEKEYNFLILDLSMPGLSGVDILKKLRIEKPELPIIIISIHPEKHYALRCLKAGAYAYLTKDKATEELLTAIKSIMDGRKYITPSLAADLADYAERPAINSPHEFLSNREYQIFLMLASGKTTGQIAVELYLSAKTVSTYRSRILQKMQLKDNADIVSYAAAMELI